MTQETEKREAMVFTEAQRQALFWPISGPREMHKFHQWDYLDSDGKYVDVTLFVCRHGGYGEGRPCWEARVSYGVKNKPYRLTNKRFEIAWSIVSTVLVGVGEPYMAINLDPTQKVMQARVLLTNEEAEYLVAKGKIPKPWPQSFRPMDVFPRPQIPRAKLDALGMAELGGLFTTVRVKRPDPELLVAVELAEGGKE